MKGEQHSDVRKSVKTKHIFLGLYGEPGVGKTRLISTSPGKVLLIRPPVDHTNSIDAANRRRIQEVVISDWDEMNSTLDLLRHEGSRWDWVWIDSLSLLQDVLLDDIWETVIAENPKRKRYGLDQGDYGVNMSRIGRWLRYAVGPDQFNLGFTAHPAMLPSPDFDREGDPIDKLMPWVQGKQMPQKCCGYMNVVGFLSKTRDDKNKERLVLRTQGNQHFYAKDHFHAIRGSMVEPTMPRIIQAVDKARGSTAATPKRRVKLTRRTPKEG